MISFALALVAVGLLVWRKYEPLMVQNWGTDLGIALFGASAFVTQITSWVPWGMIVAMIALFATLIGLFDALIDSKGQTQ